jgi:hypothetical protein
MKNALILTAAFVAGAALSFVFVNVKETKRRLEIAEHSFATGCLVSALNSCSFATGELAKARCRGAAMDSCEPAAVKFRKWIEQGKRK